MLQTEFPFTLPCGYVDERGTLHRQGVMRVATALDEVEPAADTRVRANELYLVIVLLSRVVTRIGEISPITTAVVERLFAADFSYLQDLYMLVNRIDSGVIETECPKCRTRFMLDGDERVNCGEEN